MFKVKKLVVESYNSEEKRIDDMCSVGKEVPLFSFSFVIATEDGSEMTCSCMDELGELVNEVMATESTIVVGTPDMVFETHLKNLIENARGITKHLCDIFVGMLEGRGFDSIDIESHVDELMSDCSSDYQGVVHCSSMSDFVFFPIYVHTSPVVHSDYTAVGIRVHRDEGDGMFLDLAIAPSCNLESGALVMDDAVYFVSSADDFSKMLRDFEGKGVSLTMSDNCAVWGEFGYDATRNICLAKDVMSFFADFIEGFGSDVNVERECVTLPANLTRGTRYTVDVEGAFIELHEVK